MKLDRHRIVLRLNEIMLYRTMLTSERENHDYRPGSGKFPRNILSISFNVDETWLYSYMYLNKGGNV